MDRNLLSVAPDDLYSHLGTASAPLLVDVRDEDSFSADNRLIVGAFHRPADDVGYWMKELPFGRPVVTYCSQGRVGSQRAAEALRTEGIKAAHLEGGLSGWEERNLPTRKNLGAMTDKWVTREHPKIDRIACPWLISRFINPNAAFIYVPADEVAATAKAAGAIPYDIKGAEFGHVGDRCSFDAIVRIFDIKDPALDEVATIVRGADTSRRDLAPQCEGLYAISFGLSANFPDDHEMLRHGLVIYDALYAWCRRSQVASGGDAVRAPA
jgi:rhodanese-related sulfurtransferase